LHNYSRVRKSLWFGHLLCLNILLRNCWSYSSGRGRFRNVEVKFWEIARLKG
jgi:hypothetical protein